LDTSTFYLITDYMKSLGIVMQIVIVTTFKNITSVIVIAIVYCL